MTMFPFATSTIVAQAFSLVELSAPSSFADDSDQARDAALHWPTALDLCLEAGDWSFASRMVALPEAALPPGVITDPDLPHAFRLPGDCVVFREIKRRGVRHRLDEDFLRADTPAPLPIRYTRRVTDEAAMPAGYRAQLALQLAVLLAPRWLGPDAKRERLVAQLDDLRARAARTDARTASPEVYSDDLTGFGGDWVSEALR